MNRPEHKFVGTADVCETCFLTEAEHRKVRPGDRHKPRPEHAHKGEGDVCETCGEPREKHRLREKRPRGARKKRTDREKRCYIGIDGEGQGTSDHRYTLLAARRENGNESWTVEAPPGGRLSTVECLEMILSLPHNSAKIFAFSFNYDLTKILTDVDDASLFLLFRPELRQRKGADAFKGPYAVKWGEYSLNLQGTKFSVAKGWVDGKNGKPGRAEKRVVIWDLFKFFQSKFVGALESWRVGSKELHARMSAMKNKRGGAMWNDLKAIREYCLEECQCIAELAHKLIDAHEAAGLELTSYYGAGSSGAAMLSSMGIKERIVPVPDAMKEAVACAFSGGRFEQSVIGPIEGPIYNYDISSAYPYSTTFLPCLEHGTWTLSEDRNDVTWCRAALVQYALGDNPGITSWGPFPFRTDDGTISYPIESGGGWVWRDEFMAGEKLFPHVQFRQAWIYQCTCDCRPFAKIPEYYLERLKLGKEGAGLVLKLAVNSVYGKLAQSVGNAMFANWIWAGMITSSCRAQILDALGLHKDWANLLTIATDGIYTRERLCLPPPRSTGTGVVIDGKSKPLGGWEEKVCKKGVFFARPGIYFPLEPTKEEIREVRARGVGRGVILEHWRSIVDTWHRDGIAGVARVPDVVRFIGAKTAISRSSRGYVRAEPGRVGPDGFELPAYGQWIRRKVEMSFEPLPKRAGLRDDGRTLRLRTFPKTLESLPYDRAMLSAEAVEMRAGVQEILEQPDGDFMEMGEE